MALDWTVLKTRDVMLKLLETVIGAVCFGLIVYYSSGTVNINPLSSIVAIYSAQRSYFLLISFAILLLTTLEIASFLVEHEHMKKAFSVAMSSVLGTLLYFTASVTLSVQVSKMYKYSVPDREVFLAVVVLGFLNSVFYALSSFWAIKSFRRE